MRGQLLQVVVVAEQSLSPARAHSRGVTLNPLHTPDFLEPWERGSSFSGDELEPSGNSVLIEGDDFVAVSRGRALHLGGF